MLRLARLRIVNLRARHERLQHIRQHLRVRTRRQRALLRPAQLRRRDHLHGLGDLPRVNHAANAATDVENIGHETLLWLLALSCGLSNPSQQPKAKSATSLPLPAPPRTAASRL